MNKSIKKISVFLAKFLILLIVITVLWVLFYRYVNPPITPLMIDRYFGGKSGINKEWKSYDNISDNMKVAVIAAEDQKFPKHSGFDLESIQDAIEDKLVNGEKLRGASTISQQTAKNVFLWPSRSWTRKGAEAYFTFLIETMWDKERVLEVYLNVIETGDGIYGVEKASQIYFGKPAKNLSVSEAALIAAVLPNPRFLSPSKPSSYVRRRQNWIIRQMNNLGGGSYIRKLEGE